MQIITKTFESLSIDELYAILRLRSDVFVVEQECAYQDVDGKDADALHVIGKSEGDLVGYARCFPPGIYFDEAAIGRVVIAREYRKAGKARELMIAAIAAVESNFGTTEIKVSAQRHLQAFYNSLGFQKTGEGYLEDGIPHISMVKH